MAGDTVVKASQPIEWVDETTFAAEEADAAWNWFGLGTSWNPTQGVNQETIDYLPEFNSNNKLSKKVNVKHSEMWQSDLTYHPQNFNLLKFFTGTAGGTSETLPSIQVGQVDEDNDEYQRLLGGVGEEVTVSVDEDGSFEVDGSFIFGDGTNWVDIDYANDTGIVVLSAAVTPTTDTSVGVSTSSVTTGEVILYDGSGGQLARVNADTSYVAADVGGTDVASVRLVNMNGPVTGETISVNPETDGSGTDETATVSSSNAHAAEDTTEPFKYADLSNVTYGGTALDGAIESLEFTISNDITTVKDPDAGRGSLIAAFAAVDRDITVDVTLTYNNMNMASEVRSYTPKTFSFDIGTTTFTIDDVQFPEYPFELTPTDLVSDSISSDPATDISWV